MRMSRAAVYVNNYKSGMFTPNVYTKNADWTTTKYNCKHVNNSHTPVYIHKGALIGKNAYTRQFPRHHSVCARVYCLQDGGNDHAGI